MAKKSFFRKLKELFTEQEIVEKPVERPVVKPITKTIKKAPEKPQTPLDELYNEADLPEKIVSSPRYSKINYVDEKGQQTGAHRNDEIHLEAQRNQYGSWDIKKIVKLGSILDPFIGHGYKTDKMLSRMAVYEAETAKEQGSVECYHAFCAQKGLEFDKDHITRIMRSKLLIDLKDKFEELLAQDVFNSAPDDVEDDNAEKMAKPESKGKKRSKGVRSARNKIHSKAKNKGNKPKAAAVTEKPKNPAKTPDFKP